MTMLACRHCAREMSTRHLPQHERACIDNPTINAAIRTALTNQDAPGMAVTTKKYDERRQHLGAPSIATLFARWRSWRSICAAFGLTAPPDRTNFALSDSDGRRERTDCPHCHHSVGAHSLGAHMAVCPERPALHDAIRAAMQHPALDGIGVSQLEYSSAAARVPGLPSRRTLEKHFGGWRAALAHFGLVLANDAEVIELQAMAEVEREKRAMLEVLRQERDGAYGLQVLRVRPLPGVKIDGRECVAVMIR